MGATKDNDYTNEELLISKICRAIAHPARAKIVSSLLNSKSIKNKQLSKLLNLSQATVKDHLTMLKDADLIHIKYKPHEYIISLKRENLDFLKTQI